MSVREYIGARYVPMFADPIEWDDSLVYEPLTVVKYEGASYVSRREVPEGIALDNEDYWILWADFNAQLQHYIDEVNTFNGRISDLEDAVPIASFDENDTVKDYIDDVDDKLGSGFTSENTVKDAFTLINADNWVTTDRINDEAVTTAKINDEAITMDKLSDEVTGMLDEVANKYKGVFNTPVLQGIVRLDSHKFDNQTEETRRAQGFCVANGNFYVIFGSLDSANAALYTRAINGTQFAYVKELQTYHSSDIIFIDEINQYWVSHGTSGTISRFDSTFNLISTFTIGSSATLLAYDKVTGKIYANDYWGAVYEVDPYTYETTLIINSVINNSYKQSIAAHNGILYVLYSYPSRIVSYSIETGEIVNSISIGENNILPIGETEGIDTNDNGDIYIASHTQAAANSVILCTINVLQVESNQVNPIIAEWRTNVFVGDRSSLFLSAQTPNGTEANPFATIDEAILCIGLNPNITQIVVIGNHEVEQPYITFPCTFMGQSTNNVKPKVGRIYTIGGFLFVNNIDFAPAIEVSSFINGYRNGPISYYQCSSSGTHATPTSHDITSQYPVNTTFSNNVDW